jgi:hypothetical protein
MLLYMYVPQQYLFGGFPYLSLSPPPQLQMTSVTFRSQLISGWVIGYHGDSEGNCRAYAITKRRCIIIT